MNILIYVYNITSNVTELKSHLESFYLKLYICFLLGIKSQRVTFNKDGKRKNNYENHKINSKSYNYYII